MKREPGEPINGVEIDWDRVVVTPELEPADPPTCPYCDSTQEPEELLDGRFLCNCCSRLFVQP